MLLMAYAGLRWWLCGQEAGHRAHDYAALEMDVLRVRVREQMNGQGEGRELLDEVDRLEMRTWIALRRSSPVHTFGSL